MENLEPPSDAPCEGLRAGARDGMPFALAGLLVSVSFGVLAKPVLGFPATLVMSALVFAGSAQFAALAALALRLPLIGVVVLAAGATALLRAIG